jgi:hypothetical protein
MRRYLGVARAAYSRPWVWMVTDLVEEHPLGVWKATPRGAATSGSRVDTHVAATEGKRWWRSHRGRGSR